ncbi:hypothetical protein B5G34_14150 [Flavonifractor sp. An82]|nr:hypothetical protein B5G34_14150 [Flavonifractor sp. An82]
MAHCVKKTAAYHWYAAVFTSMQNFMGSSRPCLNIGDMPSGEEFWPLASNFFAGILTDFKEKLCRPGGKRPGDWAC